MTEDRDIERARELGRDLFRRKPDLKLCAVFERTRIGDDPRRFVLHYISDDPKEGRLASRYVELSGEDAAAFVTAAEAKGCMRSYVEARERAG